MSLFTPNVSIFISIFSHQILREKIGDLYINIINKKISSESHNSETSEIENINFLVSEMSLDICRNAGALQLSSLVVTADQMRRRGVCSRTSTRSRGHLGQPGRLRARAVNEEGGELNRREQKTLISRR